MPTPANAMNLSSSAGIVSWDGTATMATTAVTQYNVLVGATGSNTIANITPTANSGWVLTSNGLASNPTFQAIPYTSLPWTGENSSFAAASNNGYFVTANATGTLPAAPAQGDTISFAVDNGTAILTIQANTGQIVRSGKTVSASAGTCVSNFNGDSITLVYRTSDSCWLATSILGTWAIT